MALFVPVQGCGEGMVCGCLKREAEPGRCLAFNVDDATLGGKEQAGDGEELGMRCGVQVRAGAGVLGVHFPPALVSDLLLTRRSRETTMTVAVCDTSPRILLLTHFPFVISDCRQAKSAAGGSVPSPCWSDLIVPPSTKCPTPVINEFFGPARSLRCVRTALEEEVARPQLEEGRGKPLTSAKSGDT